MIFENQPGNSVKRIGILPSAGEQYYPEDISVWEWPLMRLIVYIFIFGIMSMCCVGNFKRCSKDVLRALRYRKVRIWRLFRLREVLSKGPQSEERKPTMRIWESFRSLSNRTRGWSYSFRSRNSKNRRSGRNLSSNSTLGLNSHRSSRIIPFDLFN